MQKVQLLLLLQVTAGSAQVNYYSYAETAFHRLQEWYSSSSGIWSTAGWWNNANCLTAVANLALIDGNVQSEAASIYASTFANAPNAGLNPHRKTKRSTTPFSSNARFTRHDLWNGTLVPAGLRLRQDESSGFVDSCSDDDGWWALAWIAAYDQSGTSAYLQTAEGLFSDMAKQGPTSCNNGGIYWECSSSPHYVNAISNELYLSIAAHLANRPTGNANYYWGIAQSQWSWFQNSGLINSQHLINDGLDSNCQNNGEQAWSYNQGVILGALAEMYTYSKDSSYLSTAQTLATAAIRYLADDNNVITEPGCDPNCSGDGSQFKGAFIRNLVALWKVDRQSSLANTITATANAIWANDQEGGSIGVNWDGPLPIKNLDAISESSGLEALNAAIIVNNS